MVKIYARFSEVAIPTAGRERCANRPVFLPDWVCSHATVARAGALCPGGARRMSSCAMKTSRPKKSPRVTEHTSLRLEPELREALQQAAERERRPLANLMRIALSDWLEGRSSAGYERRPA